MAPIEQVNQLTVQCKVMLIDRGKKGKKAGEKQRERERERERERKDGAEKKKNERIVWPTSTAQTCVVACVLKACGNECIVSPGRQLNWT